MLEKTLLNLLMISIYGNVVLAIITIVLLSILTILVIKNNHSSANQ